jgi:hypothetical protein
MKQPSIQFSVKIQKQVAMQKEIAPWLFLCFIYSPILGNNITRQICYAPFLRASLVDFANCFSYAHIKLLNLMTQRGNSVSYTSWFSTENILLSKFSRLC